MACKKSVFKRIRTPDGKEVRWSGDDKKPRPDGEDISPFWYFEFEVAGVKICESSKTANKREAGDAKIRRWGDVKDNQRKVQETNAPVGAPVTIGDAVDRWQKEVGDSLPTGFRVERDFERIMAWEETPGVFPLGRNVLLVDMTTDKIARLIAWMKQRPAWDNEKAGRVGNTQVYNCTIKTLRRIAVRCREIWGVNLPKKPKWRELNKMLPRQKKRSRKLSYAEHVALSKALSPDYEEFRLFSLASGMRKSECLLEWSEVDLNAMLINTIGKGEDGGKVIQKPITPTMMKILSRQIGKHVQYVFTYSSRRGGDGRVRGERYPITSAGLTSEWRRARIEAAKEVPSLIDPTRRRSYRLHDNRRTFGTNVSKFSGGRTEVIQELMGHADFKTSMGYLDTDDDEKRGIMEEASRASIFESSEDAA